jgi:hypothetical protein
MINIKINNKNINNQMAILNFHLLRIEICLTLKNKLKNLIKIVCISINKISLNV